MAGGTGINNVYNQFGANANEAIIIAIVVSASDTKSKLLSAYASNGCVPEFPIILNSQGGSSCAQLFGQPTTGGPSWMLHPDREYTSTSYSQSMLASNLTKALDDDCNGSVITYTLTVNGGSGDGAYKEGASATIKADAAPTGKIFDKWTGEVDAVVDINSATTTLLMPALDITVTATYKDYIVDFVLMPSGTENFISVTDTLFYDSEGPSADYLEDFSGEITFLPGESGKVVKIEFLEFNIEDSSDGTIWDSLTIYNGSDKSNIIGYWYGNNSPGTVTSTAPNGALTVRFSSDQSAVGSGWKAHITLDDVTVNNKSMASLNIKHLSVYNGKIDFYIPEGNASTVHFNLYNMQGACIFSIVKDNVKSGNSSILLESLTSGSKLAKGAYILQMKSGKALFRSMAIIER